MAASTNDLLKKSGASTVTTLSAPGKALGATSINVGSTTNYPTDTGIVIAIRQVDSNGDLVAGTYTEWSATVASATSLSIVATPVYGSDQIYSAGSTTQVYIPLSSYAHNKLIDNILEHANQDGTLITQAVRDALNLDSGSSDGWTPFGYSLTSITALGNRSYTAVVSGVDTTGTTSVGMRLKLPRTVTAPTQCTSLNGTTQYYSKTSPSGIAFTTTFTCSAWVKLSSYQAGGIIARRNADTEGWSFRVNASGQVELAGLRIVGNSKYITSYQSVPLNKWVHVAATMDMTAADTTAQKIWIDGVEVPRSYTLTGTATALVQGTTALVVGAGKSVGTELLPGKIAQAAVFSSQLADATVKAMANQTMTGSETGLVSAYTFNNSINDLSANANNLTAQGSAVATNADTPFTNAVTGTSVTAGTTNYGIIMAQTFSTNTTYTIQIPEGETLPTTGGIGTVSYSTQKTPYGFISDESKWTLTTISRGSNINNGASTGDTYYNVGSMSLSVPVGVFKLTANINVQATMGAATSHGAAAAIGSSAGNSKDVAQATGAYSASADVRASCYMNAFVRPTTATSYYINIASVDQNATNLYLVGATQDCILTAECTYV